MSPRRLLRLSAFALALLASAWCNAATAAPVSHHLGDHPAEPCHQLLADDHAQPLAAGPGGLSPDAGPAVTLPGPWPDQGSEFVAVATGQLWPLTRSPALHLWHCVFRD